MAGFRLTSKTQITGWRFLLRRLEHAIVRRDTQMFDDPMQFYSRSATLGIVVAVLILVGAVAMAYFKPQGKFSGDRLFAERATNRLFIILSGRLHPVYNLTSARLVLGAPVYPSTVNSVELERISINMSKGRPIGISGAPYATPVSSDTSSVWTLCDTIAHADTAAPAIQTAVIAKPLLTDASVGRIRQNEALLVSYLGRAWIVTREGRHALDLGDRAVTLALGIPVTAKPTPISDGMFNALPNAGPWQLPPVPAVGVPNSVGLPENLAVGSVFKTYSQRGAQYFVVLPDGVAPVNATTADALRANQSNGLVEPPLVESSLVVRITKRVYSSPLPDEPLTVLSRREQPTLCWAWESYVGDQAPNTMVLVGGHLPIQPSLMRGGIKQIRGTATVFMGTGEFVGLQSPGPRYGQPMFYIDPHGVRYGMPDAQTAEALGLVLPKTAPWEIIRLLVDGPVLSKEAALLEHETLPADPSPRMAATGGSP